MHQRIAILAALMVSSLCGASQPGLPLERFNISLETMMQAIRAGGVQVRAEQISVLAKVTASQPSPQLRVLGSHKVNQADTAVKLGCESNAICLPFYVMLHGVDAVFAQVSPARTASRPLRAKDKPCIRSGNPASLVITGADMQISIPVIALQSGRPGETIRVTSADRKKIYRAEVVGPDLLKGSL